MSQKVIIYTRVSTDEQADKGYSLRHQLEMVERYCHLKEYEILKHFQDDFSAKNFNRPDWIKLEAFIKANRKQIDKVLFTKWDRFSRNIEEALGVIRKFRNWGIEVNAIEQPLDFSNPDNKAMLALYLVMPEVENDKISQRTKDGILRARKEGAYTSKPPFGYEGCRINDKASMKPSKDAEILRQMFLEVAAGVNSIEQIRKNFISKGFKGCKQAFYYMLRNKLYSGYILVPEHKKNPAYWVKGLHDGIIDDNIFAKIQSVLSGKKKNTRYPVKKHEQLPLRGFLKCSKCNENLTGSVSKGNGGKYAYYHCRKGCSNRIPEQLANQLFSDKILSPIKVNEQVLNLYSEILNDVFKTKNGDKAMIIKSLTNEIESTENHINLIEDNLLSGGIVSETFNRMNKRYTERLMNLKSEFELLKNSSDDSSEYISKSVQSLRNINEYYENGDYDLKNGILGSILDGKVYISKNECRTTNLNVVVDLICRINKGLMIDKNEKAIISDGLSIIAPPDIVLSNQFNQDLKRLAKLYDLIHSY